MAEISKAAIEGRLTELRQQQAQLIANANALHGAIQLCEELLRLVDDETAKTNEET